MRRQDAMCLLAEVAVAVVQSTLSIRWQSLSGMQAG